MGGSSSRSLAMSQFFYSLHWATKYKISENKWAIGSSIVNS